MVPKSFAELGLSDDLLKAVHKLGFEQAAPIQAAAIPLLLQGKDVVGQSQTGSGKTAAFAAPAVEKVNPAQHTTQVLILCPTRELAIQVSEEVHKLAFFKRGLHALPVYGGQSYDRQFAGLRQGAHIVIGTPGRVMDHMRRGSLKLDAVKMVVLDEVDVMLNMGFRDDIELILQSTPKERQTAFFSATIPRPIQQLIEKYSRDPQQIRFEQKALTVPTVEQVYYEVDRRFKIDLLTRLIDIHDLKLGIIFCNTKRMVDDLVDRLNAQGYSADRLHGDMTQMMRDRVMHKFRKSGLEFLVATDVAARGLDVDDVEVVFNYDLPYDGEDYVHRIGRTGRQGRSGRAISFVSGREVWQIRDIERYTNTRIRRARPPTANEVEEARALVFVDKLRAILQSGEYKRQDPLIERLLEEGFSSTDIASALIHQLQSGDAAAAKPAPRQEERPRSGDRRASWPSSAPPAPLPAAATPSEGGARGPLRAAPAAPASPSVPASVAPASLLASPKGEEKARPPLLPTQNPSALAKASPPPAPKPPPPLRHPHPPVRHAPVRPPRPEHRPPPAAPSPAPAAVVAKPVIRSAPRPTPAAVVRPASPEPRGAPAEPRPAFKPKQNRNPQPFQTRLWMNIGAETGVVPIDIVNTIAGETGLPGNIVGTVDIRERHLFADVAAEHANAIVAKLNRTRIKGQKLKVKVA